MYKNSENFDIKHLTFLYFLCIVRLSSLIIKRIFKRKLACGKSPCDMYEQNFDNDCASRMYGSSGKCRTRHNSTGEV